MEAFKYEDILDRLFLQKKEHLDKWNYQSKGELHFSDGSSCTPYDNLPLLWQVPFRIAKHPDDSVYAYASSKCKGIDGDKTSCICLFDNSNPTRGSKVYHIVDKLHPHGFDYKPAFSPDGKWLAFMSMKDFGKIGSTGTIMLAPYLNFTDKVYTLSATKNLPCQEFQWLNNNTILVEYKTKGYSKVIAISFDHANPSSNNRAFILGNLKLDPKVERGGKLIVGSFNFSTNNNIDISFLDLGKVERCEYTTEDGIQSFYWYAHPNPKYKNGRTLLLCQGGPHHAWEPDIECGTYHIPLLQHLGYSVIMPIVRGMPGITDEFDNEIRGDWGGKCIQDYLIALDTAIDRFKLDVENIALLGHSFGGFCAYSMNVLHPERFRCFIAESAPFNLETFVKYCMDESTRNDTILSEIRDGLVNPDGDYVMEKMLKQSPSLLLKSGNVREKSKPILIIHGKNDKRIPYKQSEEAYKDFKYSELVPYDEGHTFILNKRDRYDRVLRFLNDNMD